MKGKQLVSAKKEGTNRKSHEMNAIFCNLAMSNERYWLRRAGSPEMYINGSVFDNYIILYIMHIISLTMFDNYRQAHLAMEHHHHHRFQSFQRVKLGGFPLPFLSTRGYTHTLSLSFSLSLFLSLSLSLHFFVIVGKSWFVHARTRTLSPTSSSNITGKKRWRKLAPSKRRPPKHHWAFGWFQYVLIDTGNHFQATKTIYKFPQLLSWQCFQHAVPMKKAQNPEILS